jgi:hypothetical protein
MQFNASGRDENEQRSKYPKTWENKPGKIVVGHLSSLFWRLFGSVGSDEQRSYFTLLSLSLSVIYKMQNSVARDISF